MPRMSRYTRQVVAVIVVLLVTRIVFRNLIMLSHVHNEMQDRLNLGFEPSSHVDLESQRFVDYLAHHLVVRYDVVDNLLHNMNVSVRITLSNSGQHTIPRSGWQLYFFHFRMIEKHRLEHTGTAVLPEYGIRITHVNGGLFRLEPTPKFEPLTPGHELAMSLLSPFYTVGRYDFMPNWYVVAQNARPRILECTRGEELAYVGPFDTPNKWKRQKEDRFDPYTMEHRYEVNVAGDLGRPGQPVLPTPVAFTVSEAEKVMLDPKEWLIITEHSLKEEANLISALTKIPVKNDARMPSKNYIHLQQLNVQVPGARNPDSPEAYILDIDPANQRILISGTTSAGAFYAIQTLLSLISTYGLTLPKALVKDSPRYGYRGLMVDVARNFFNVTEMKKLIDVMAMYKLNRLHLHLTDDEGWRIEIPGLPELTEVGGRRCHDPQETHCLMPCLGSGPQATELGSGFYTVEQYRDILRHAAARHVEMIPEIDMPGHSNAAIKSMRARYLHYRHSSPELASEFLLHDLQESTTYMSGQMFKFNCINPCMESSYRFVEHVMSSLVHMHADIAPLRTFHVGGDEVPGSAWSGSAACRSYAQANPELRNVHDLKEHFVRRVIRIAARQHLSVQGWEDAFYSKDNHLFDRNKLGYLDEGRITANVWISKWEGKKSHRAHEMANQGYQVVLSSATSLYFDHHQEPDPEERGLYWAARFIDLKKVFHFMPENFFENIDMDRLGNPLDRKQACATLINCMKLERTQNIVGMQGQIWGETIRQSQHLESMLLPRLLALAERSWHSAPWERETEPRRREELHALDWRDFVNTLGYKELTRLEKVGVAYYLPIPGAKQENGKLLINTAIPNMVIQFSKDGGATWQDLTSGYKLQGKVLLASRSFDSRYRSRQVELTV